MNYQIKKDSATIQKEISTNIVKMLADRKWIVPSNIDKLSLSMVQNKNDDDIYTIKLDNKLLSILTYDPFADKTKWKNFDDKQVAILFIHQKIVSKSPTISDFIVKYGNVHKIIIVEDISEKGKNIILSSANNMAIEIFTENEMMIHLLEHVCSPRYEILTQEEADNVRESYNMTKRQMPRIYDSDMAVRHFYLKKEQVVRIIRNSELTCENISYRIVVHKGNATM